jgi:hypothetical protein
LGLLNVTPEIKSKTEFPQRNYSLKMSEEESRATAAADAGAATADAGTRLWQPRCSSTGKRTNKNASDGQQEETGRRTLGGKNKCAICPADGPGALRAQVVLKGKTFKGVRNALIENLQRERGKIFSLPQYRHRLLPTYFASSCHIFFSSTRLVNDCSYDSFAS